MTNYWKGVMVSVIIGLFVVVAMYFYGKNQVDNDIQERDAKEFICDGMQKQNYRYYPQMDIDRRELATFLNVSETLTYFMDGEYLYGSLDNNRITCRVNYRACWLYDTTEGKPKTVCSIFQSVIENIDVQDWNEWAGGEQ